MDTIYYHLNAKKVKVSGGADLVTYIPDGVAISAGEGPRGEVLDFAACRQRLETRNAWKDLTAAVRETADLAGENPAEDQPMVEAAAPRVRRSHGGDWLELCASAAILLVSLAAVWAFLHLI